MSEQKSESQAIAELRSLLQRGELTVASGSNLRECREILQPPGSALELAVKSAAEIVKTYPLAELGHFIKAPVVTEGMRVATEAAQGKMSRLMAVLFLWPLLPSKLAEHTVDTDALTRLGVAFTAETLVMGALLQPLQGRVAAGAISSAYFYLSSSDVAQLRLIGPDIPPAKFRNMVTHHCKNLLQLTGYVERMQANVIQLRPQD